MNAAPGLVYLLDHPEVERARRAVTAGVRIGLFVFPSSSRPVAGEPGRDEAPHVVSSPSGDGHLPDQRPPRSCSPSAVAAGDPGCPSPVEAVTA